MLTVTQVIDEFYKEYDHIGFEMVRELADELRYQGHVASGDLLRSIVHVVDRRMDEVENAISHLKYGVDLNTGIPASKIPTGGVEYARLLGNLVKWIRLRRLAFGAGKAFRFAKNIINKAQVTGFPLPGSYRFTKNGRRKYWIDYVVQTKTGEWVGMVDTASEKLANGVLEAKLKEIQAMFPKYVTIK